MFDKFHIETYNNYIVSFVMKHTRGGDVMKMVNRNWLTELRGNESQEVVADRAGVSRSNYTNIENGLRSPSVDTAKKIAGALNFEWTRFFN